MSAKTHTLNLIKGSVQLLRQIITAHSWADNAADTYRASQIAENVLPTDFEPPLDPKLLKDFVNEPIEIQVTEKQRETMKRCVEAHCKKGAFIAGRPIQVLLAELGLAPEE